MNCGGVRIGQRLLDNVTRRSEVHQPYSPFPDHHVRSQVHNRSSSVPAILPVSATSQPSTLRVGDGTIPGPALRIVGRPWRDLPDLGGGGCCAGRSARRGRRGMRRCRPRRWRRLGPCCPDRISVCGWDETEAQIVRQYYARAQREGGTLKCAFVDLHSHCNLGIP